MIETDLFHGQGVRVLLPDDDAFLKIKETLQRIGVASRKEKTLWQSCHILHKQSNYAIIHFKELFALDGKETDFSEDDRQRRNAIAGLLAEWGLVKIINPDQIIDKAPMSHIKVLRYSEKSEWKLCAKYEVGKKRNYE